MVFSKNFKTYQTWRRNRKLTAYSKGIIRLHKKFPNKTLAKLVGRNTIDIGKRTWLTLSPSQKSTRKLALKALSEMRRGKSLLSSAKEYGLDADTVKKHLKSAIRKKGSVWIAKKTDKIQRSMVINTFGKARTIIVTNSRDASLIGKYHNAVKQFLQTGDESFLKPFRNRKIKDVKGKYHVLETDPQKLFDIEEAKEDPEFFEIYESD